ncbi:hypothetical protein E4U55_001552 [Claviceps digitariae]|nr:hypothetical protein E4U55_001552 [Claviceps digitariae]
MAMAAMAIPVSREARALWELLEAEPAAVLEALVGTAAAELGVVVAPKLCGAVMVTMDGQRFVSSET